ncbi:MAG TPA: MFS transporter [Thermomicrobiales bacterium]|nr:MFS transporter [Thermomicrobiales bacterium]
MEQIDRTVNKGMILFLVCLAQFMVVLDLAIVNVALPSIQLDLNMRQSAVQWIVIAYGLTLGGFLLLGGRLGDLLGRRKILLTGLVLFSSASLLAGLAGSAQILIAARGLQGFGAALMAPSALSILAVTFTEGAERNRSLGIFGAVGGTSASIGVIASGLLTDGPGWRWIFFINIPIGIALILLAYRYLPRDAAHDGARHYDALGAATITGSLVLFIYGLNRGVDHGWSSMSTLALFVAAAALLLAFVRVEARASSPLVPFAALRNRIMVTADLVSFLVLGGLFSFFFLGTLLMQEELGYSPTRTGLAWLATSVPAFILAGVTGAKLVNRVGVRKLLVAGPLILAVGAAWMTRIHSGADFLTDLFPAFVLAGIAIGLSAPSIQIGALSGVKGEHIGLASGLVETTREIGGAVAIAVVSTVLVSQTVGVAGGRGAIELQGFRYAFYVIVVAALAGAFISSVGFPSRMPVARLESELPTDDELVAEPV